MNDRLKKYFEESDYLRNDTAEKLGVSRASLSIMVAKGELKRVAQGVYALPDNLIDDWAVIAGRSPKIIFSHESALALHALHNRIPEIQSITIPQVSNAPRSIAGFVKVYRVKPEWHEIGKSEAITPLGHKVPCYDPERTICDIVRAYSRINVEVYADALRTYSKSRYDIGKLMKYARILCVEEKVRKAIEVLI